MHYVPKSDNTLSVVVMLVILGEEGSGGNSNV